MVPLKIVSNVSRFKPELNLNRVLADLSRGSNSLNSASGYQNCVQCTFDMALDFLRTKLELKGHLSIPHFYAGSVVYINTIKTTFDLLLISTKMSRWININMESKRSRNRKVVFIVLI